MRFALLALLAGCAVAAPDFDPSGAWEIDPMPAGSCSPLGPWSLRIRRHPDERRYLFSLSMPSDPFSEPTTEKRIACEPGSCSVHAKQYFDIDLTLADDGTLEGSAESDEVCGAPLPLEGRRSGDIAGP